jgi:hypothetical protein
MNPLELSSKLDHNAARAFKSVKSPRGYLHSDRQEIVLPSNLEYPVVNVPCAGRIGIIYVENSFFRLHANNSPTQMGHCKPSSITPRISFTSSLLSHKFANARIPDSMSFEESALCEPLSVALQACKRTGIPRLADVLIFGAGPIGLLCASVVKARGLSVSVTVAGIF